jgi:hypothetical protein
MRRNMAIVVLVLFAVVALSGAAFVGGTYWTARPEKSQAPRPDLLQPLPGESDADLAAAMPVIDDLRARRGSVVDGTLLSVAPPNSGTDAAYINLLRLEARRLDDLANDNEEQLNYGLADSFRAEASALREKARELTAEPYSMIQFGKSIDR